MTSFDDNQMTKKLLATSITEKILLIITVLLILLSSVYLINKSLSLNFEEYQKYRNSIIELQELDSTFNQEVLKSRYELFADYDPLVRSLAKQKKLEVKLQDIPTLGIVNENKTIEQFLGKIREQIESRENLGEKFKSRNALLKNSLRYLPLLTSQIESRFDAQSQTESLTNVQISVLRTTLNALIRNLLLYNIAIDDQLNSEIESLTQRLSALDIQYELTEEQFPTELVKSHANIILTVKPQIEKLTTQLLRPLNQYTDRLKTSIDSRYQQAVRQVNLYRIFSLIWFLMLLLFINYFLWKKLHQINPGLSRYKSQVGKLNTALTDIFQSKQTLSSSSHIDASTYTGNYNLPAKVESTEDRSNLVPVSTQSVKISESELSGLANRPDELGQLAKQVQAIIVEQINEENFISSDNSGIFLTARLILVTKDRRRMISPQTIESLTKILSHALEDFSCQLIDIEGSLEQVQILFNYSPQVQLLQLVNHLKTVSASYLEQNLGDILARTDGTSQIWSNSYSLYSCEVSNAVATKQ